MFPYVPTIFIIAFLDKVFFYSIQFLIVYSSFTCTFKIILLIFIPIVLVVNQLEVELFLPRRLSKVWQLGF